MQRAKVYYKEVYKRQIIRPGTDLISTVAVLGKIFGGGAWPLIIWEANDIVSEITIEPISGVLPKN